MTEKEYRELWNIVNKGVHVEYSLKEHICTIHVADEVLKYAYAKDAERLEAFCDMLTKKRIIAERNAWALGK